MNALLLYPWFPETFWSMRHALRFIRKRAVAPPLGLLTVAAMLPEDWGKRLIDLNVNELTDADLAWADIALVSAMGVQEASARQVIARCRQAGVRVVAGGPLFSGEPHRFEDVDHLVLNEAELTLPPFLKDLAGGTPSHLYSTEEFADVRQTPMPLWRLVDMRHYASMSIQYSRGCPFNCDFCNVTALFGRKPRIKSTAQILAELSGLYARGWRGQVFFVDDNLIGNKKALKTELLPALIDWRRGRRGFAFNTQVSINLADDATTMKLMADAGFDTVFIGIETPDNDSLVECSKVQNKNRDLVADVKRIQRAGMQVQGGFIVGFDNDRPSIFQRQIDFIQSSGIVTAMVGLLQALPGTRLFERLHGENRLLGHGSGDNVDGTTNFAPAMGLETLRQGYEQLMRHLYSPRNYYQRIRTLLREYRLPRATTPLGAQRLLAAVRSAIRLGMFGRERLEFWGLLCWTAWHRPRLMSHAITLAILGHHFRRICETQLAAFSS